MKLGDKFEVKGDDNTFKAIYIKRDHIIGENILGKWHTISTTLKYITRK